MPWGNCVRTARPSPAVVMTEKTSELALSRLTRAVSSLPSTSTVVSGQGIRWPSSSFPVGDNRTRLQGFSKSSPRLMAIAGIVGFWPGWSATRPAIMKLPSARRCGAQLGRNGPAMNPRLIHVLVSSSRTKTSQLWTKSGPPFMFVIKA